MNMFIFNCVLTFFDGAIIMESTLSDKAKTRFGYNPYIYREYSKPYWIAWTANDNRTKGQKGM